MTLADLVYIEKGLAAARPAAGSVPGKRRGWYSTDTGELSISDGSTWTVIGGGGSGIADPGGSNDDVLQRKAGAWANRTIAQLLTDLAAPGTTFQPLDSDLTAIAALSTTSFGRSLLAAADAAALRTLAGLVIGTDVQAHDADLDTLAALGFDGNAAHYLDGSGAWSTPVGGGGSGSELDYVQTTSSLTVTATTDATAQAFATGNSVAYDGSTAVLIECYVPFASATVAIVFNLYDGSTDLGRLGQLNSPTTAGTNLPMLLARRLTPSNASHTYSVRAWKTSGTASANCGAGGTATTLPGFIRITKA